MKEPFEIMTDQEDHYSLRWNNHQSHILRAFDTLLQTKTLVDVTLVCAETSIRAHKVVLSACSPFFQRVFSETPCKHPVIVLKDFRGWVVQAIVDFMYRGEISVPQERLSVLIQAGESLQVRGLVDHPVAGGSTPTPAHSPAEDFSSGLLDRSSLISPTSPSLPSPNFPPNNPSRHHGTSGGSTGTPKMTLLPPQVFADPAISLQTSCPAELCTSPMPRRKQARPRRRSGDCAPQDLSSKPVTPVPQTPEDGKEEPQEEEEEEERAAEEELGDEDDLEGLEEEDEDDQEEEEEELEDVDLKRILCRSQSVDEKLAAMAAVAAAAKEDSAASEERRSRSLHQPPSAKGDRRSRSKGDSDGLQMPSLTPSSSGSSSVSDGPENLCMKKRSSPSSINNQHPASGPAGSASMVDGLGPNADHRHSPAVRSSSSRDGSSRLGGGGGGVSESMKDISAALTDPAGLGRGGLLSLKDIRHLNRTALNRSLGSLSPPPSFASALNNNLHPALGLLSHHHHHQHLHHPHHNEAKRVKMEHREEMEHRALLAAHDDMEPPHFLDHMDLALGTHQHPLAGHPHLPQLRPPPLAGLLEGIGPENNVATSGNNSGSGNGGKKNNHNSFLNHQHHQHHHGNANSKHHHHGHQHHGHQPPQHHHHPHLQQSTGASGSPGAQPPPPPPTGNGDGPGGPLSSSGNNNNTSNGGNNNSSNNSSGSKNNNNNNNNLHHPSHHPHGGGGGGGPKGGGGSAGGPGPKDFLHSPTLNFPPFFNHGAGSDGPPPRPPHSPLPFPHMPSVSSLTLTPPHMFGLDSPLGLFPPGMDPGKIYSPLMEMSDPRGMHHDGPPFLKKKMNRPKGQHSAPRGGPPRSWTNAELTEALQHVWNKKMTTSQASRIFGIPYNSLLMYVRGKYGKSLKLEQLRKDCISGPPIELLQMGVSNSKEKKEPKDSDQHHHGNSGPNGGNSSGGGGGGGGGAGGAGGLGDLRGPRSASSEPDLLSSPNPLFNPFPGGFYPDFPSGFPGLPLSMLNLLPPERSAHQPHSLPMAPVDEDCKSDRSKQSLDDDYPQPLALNRPASEQLTDNRREIYQQNGQD